MGRLPAFLAAAAIVLGACAGPPPPTPPTATGLVVPTLSVANGTTITVIVAVNGAVVATVPAGETDDPIVAPLPPQPWTVEARSPGGRVLAALTAGRAQAVSAAESVSAFADLACGPLALWAGGPRGDHPAASPASPGPCD